jgi:hypothetical protein
VWEGTLPQASQQQPLHSAFLAEPIVRSVNNAVAPPLAAQASVAQPTDRTPIKRTAGMKLFDFFLYPVLTNLAVFAISVAATYHSHQKAPDWGIKTPQWATNLHEKYGQTPLKYATQPLLATYKALKGNPLKERGNVVRGWVQPFLGEKAAAALVMLFFSFVDGTLMIPVVKLFENNRVPITQKLDKLMATTPDDPSVYKAEPKQSWASIMGGRASVFAIIMSVFYGMKQPLTSVPGLLPLLDRHLGATLKKLAVPFEPKDSFNDLLFHKPGRVVGNWLEKNNILGIPKKFPNVKLPLLAEVSFFEFFYTSVCTAGLYGISRFYASGGGKAMVSTLQQGLQAYPALHPYLPLGGAKQARPLATQA